MQRPRSGVFRAAAFVFSGVFARMRPQPQLSRRPHRLPVHTAGSLQKGTLVMANILVSIEKGIEIGAEDALKWLTRADHTLQAAPKVVAALATLIAAIEKPLSEVAAAAANPLNIALDIQTVKDIRAALPEVKQFLTTVGVKF